MLAFRFVTPCPTCGAVPTADAAFCGSCGGKLGAPSTDPLIGQTIAAGRYKVLRRLGEGGMGTVYEVEQVSLRRRAALKVLKPALFDQPGVLRRFQSEAELAARLSHPNTVTLFDFGTMEDGGRFMTMELVTGRTLRAELERGAVPLGRALGIVRQIASSLADAHAAGIVHRDLKPDNVMLSERAGQTDFVRVLDFGIAKLRDERAGGITAMPQTQAGSLVGTPQYMSPEQITGSPVDPRTDVYALGCLMYQLVTGRLPFTGTTLPAILAQHLTEVPPAPTRVRADLQLPKALDALVLACLEKDPARRPPSMGAVLAGLERISGASSASVPVPAPAPVPVSSSSRPSPVPASPTVDAPPRRGLPLALRVAFGAAGIAAVIAGGLQLRSGLRSTETSAPDAPRPASASASAVPPSAPAVATASASDPDRPLGWPSADPSVHSVPAPVLPTPTPTPTPSPSRPPRFTRRGSWMVTTNGTRVSIPFTSPQLQVTTQDNTFVAISPIAPGEAAALTGAVSLVPPGDIASMVGPLFQTLATTLGGTVTIVDRQPLAGRTMHHATITGPAATFHAYVDIIGTELILVAIGGPETPAMHELGARWVRGGLKAAAAAPRRGSAESAEPADSPAP